MLFMAVVMLPVFFLLLTLSLDLTQLYSRRSAIQHLIDDAALYGYRFLPFKMQAEKAVSGYLRDLNLNAGQFETHITHDTVEIVYHGLAPFSFAAYWGRETGLPYEVRTQVRGTVMHAALLVDSGSATGPSNESELKGETALWPAASLFSRFSPFGNSVSSRLATQQCHNPIFSSIKRAALGIADFIGASPRNRLSIGFFPGTLSQIDTFSSPATTAGVVKVPSGYFNIANGALARNAYCLALFGTEAVTSPYILPSPGEFFPATPSDVLSATDPETHLVINENPLAVSLRELIWSRARSPASSSSRLIFSRLIDMLLEAPFDRSDFISQQPVRIGVIVTADLPTEAGEIFPAPAVKEGIRDSFKRFSSVLSSGTQSSSSQGRIYYVIVPDAAGSRHSDDIAELQNFFNELLEEQAPVKLSAQVVSGGSEEAVARGIIESLMSENRTAIINE